MEKEFVSYDLAIRLKSLGFNEPCFALYNEYKQFKYIERAPNVFWCYNSKIEYNKKLINFLSIKNFEMCSAPSYYQAFRWMREEYGYWSYIKEATKGTSRFYIEKFDEKFFNSDIYSSYEEVEKDCLEKLIELVENKTKEDERKID